LPDINQTDFNTMPSPQPAILQPVPQQARYISYTLIPGADPRAALRALAAQVDGDKVVAGLGLSLVSALGKNIDGLRSFPQMATQGIDIPSTPAALWMWLRGSDRGVLLKRQRQLDATLSAAFQPDSVIDAFIHGTGRDLTGYEDGTENPQDDAAVKAAISQHKGIAGSSFVAVQQWLHDFASFDAMNSTEQNHCVGRRRSDNEELDDAPESAHVKRTAQESFDPEAFVVRRSMPWAEGRRCGLVFTAFGASFDAYEAQLKRMTGGEDGIVDALFRFTRPLTGAYFWCPPLRDGKLDLSALGL
jgi:putative iron-dependent peroxidase